MIELKLGDTELAFTLEELDEAQDVADRMYRLKSGVTPRFLTVATLH